MSGWRYELISLLPGPTEIAVLVVGAFIYSNVLKHLNAINEVLNQIDKEIKEVKALARALEKATNKSKRPWSVDDDNDYLA